MEDLEFLTSIIVSNRTNTEVQTSENNTVNNEMTSSEHRENFEIYTDIRIALTLLKLGYIKVIGKVEG